MVLWWSELASKDEFNDYSQEMNLKREEESEKGGFREKEKREKVQKKEERREEDKGLRREERSQAGLVRNRSRSRPRGCGRKSFELQRRWRGRPRRKEGEAPAQDLQVRPAAVPARRSWCWTQKCWRGSEKTSGCGGVLAGLWHWAPSWKPSKPSWPDKGCIQMSNQGSYRRWWFSTSRTIYNQWWHRLSAERATTGRCSWTCWSRARLPEPQIWGASGWNPWKGTPKGWPWMLPGT